MSKAFTREDDNAASDGATRPIPVREGPRRPITPEGAERLEAERKKLESERARLKAEADAGSIPVRDGLRDLDARLAQLAALQDSVEIRSPQPDPDGRILFGAWVDLADEDGQPTRYRLVGPDEAEAREGRLSIQSPLARVLLGKKCGDTIFFERPRGDVSLTVKAVRY